MTRKLTELIILIKGGGEVASGVAHRLHRSHFRVCLTETAMPLAVSRGTAYCEAVYDKNKTIENVTAELVPVEEDKISNVWQKGNLPIVIDPEFSIKEILKPDVIIDATMSKTVSTVRTTDAPLVIGLGPGFYAGKNVHMIIETNNSNNLGIVLANGESEENTGIPVVIGGLAKERVIWAHQSGIFHSDNKIGDTVEAHQILGYIDDKQLKAPMGGILRGLLRSNTKVKENTKLIEIDPENNADVCFVIRDKMRAIAGGVLEAIMMKFNIPNNQY